MEIQINNIKQLLKKISTGIQQIKLRSINTLYTKITLGMIQLKQLHLYSQMPGILMNWINQNQQKNQYLYKVIKIIQYYTKTQKCLLLLKEYQCLEFFEELRTYLISNFNNLDSYLEEIQYIIKALLPLGRVQHPKSQKNNPNEQLKQTSNQQSIKTNIELLQTNHKDNTNNDNSLSFINLKQNLPQEQQKYIFDLTVQLKYGKKELQHDNLTLIRRFIKVYGKTYFRCKVQLFRQLLTFIAYNIYPYLCCQIIYLLLQALIYSEKSISSWQYKVINGDQNAIIERQKISVTIELPMNLFQNIYSWKIIQLLCQNYKPKWLHLLTSIQYKYSFSHVIQILKVLKKQQLSNSKVIQMVKFYSKSIPQSNQFLVNYINNIQKIPTLLEYQSENCAKKCFNNLLQYFNNGFNIYQNLHRIKQISQALENNIESISYDPLALSLYVDTFLALVVAVARQDPLMSYYPKIKQLMIRISAWQYQQTRIIFYGELSKTVHSHQKICYVNKQYIRSEILQMALTDQALINQILNNSLNQEQTLYQMLQILKNIQGKVKDSLLSKYQTIYFALTYHPSQKISSIANLILNRLPKKSQIKTLLMQLFSQDQQSRKNMFKQLLNSQDILSNLIQQSKIKKSKQKKLLKISENSIANYMDILMNNKLQLEIRRSAILQLSENINRAQLTENLTFKLQQLSQILLRIIIKGNNKDNIQIQILPNYIQLFLITIHKLPNNNYQLPQQLLISFFIKENKPKIKDIILEIIYLSCFRTPFTNQKKKHWVMNYYQHYQIIELEIQHKHIESKQKNLQIQKHTKEIQTKKQINNFQDYIQSILTAMLRNQPIKLDLQILQKQIANSLIHNQSNKTLSLLSYFLEQISIDLIPKQSKSISSSLINYLFTHSNLGVGQQQDIIRTLRCIGTKRNKQIESIINSNRNTISRLLILQKQETISNQQIQHEIKNLKVYTRQQIFMVYRIILKSKVKFEPLSDYSKVSLYSLIIKQIKSQDQIMKEITLYFLSNVLKSNCEFDNLNIILNAITSSLGNMLVKNYILSIQCIKLIILKQNQQNLMIRSFLEKTILLIKGSSKQFSYLLYSSSISLINTLLYKNVSYLKEIDIVDLIVNLLNEDIYQNIPGKQQQFLFMIALCCQFLYLWKTIQPQINQYLLSSTNIIYNLFTITKHQSFFNQKNTFSRKIALERIGCLIHYLALKQDYFIFKLNKTITFDSMVGDNIFNHFGKLCQYGSKQFLKMFSWLVVIEWKGRAQLDQQQTGYEICKIYLSKNCLKYCYSLIALSCSAKKALTQSLQFDLQIKKVNNILDLKAIKQMKLKKKNIKNNQEIKEEKQIENQSNQTILQFMKLLISLFHSCQKKNQIPLKKQISKKLFSLIEKFYAFSMNYTSSHQIHKQFQKLLTNLAQSQQFSQTFSNYISEGNFNMLEDICALIIKYQFNQINTKRSIILLTVLCKHQSVRNMVFRMKIIEDAVSKIIHIVQYMKRQPQSLQLIYQIISFLLVLSEYKDANLKILNDKKLLQFLVELLTQQKSAIVEQKILLLLQNLACFKQNKQIFLTNKQIHKVLLWLIGENVSYKDIIIKLIYNLVYKTSAAIKLYRKREVIQLFKSIQYEVQSKQVYDCLLEALEVGA